MVVPAVEEGARHLQAPPTMEQVPKLASYQLREYLRSRRFVALLLIVVAIGAILTAVVGYFRGDLVSTNLLFYANFWAGGVDLVIVLAAVFFGGDAIAGEFQNKTGYFLMGLPIRRSAVYVGKYIAAYVASVAMLVVFLVILVLNGAYYFGAGLFPWELLASFLIALVYLAAVLGATFLFSSLFKVSAYGFVLTAILFLFGFTLLQDLVQGLAHITPWFVISYSESVIGGVFNTSCLSEPGTHTCTVGMGPGGRALRETVTNATVPQGIAIMLAYFLITAIVGLLLFEREEFT